MSNNKKDHKAISNSNKESSNIGWDKLKVGEIHTGTVTRIEKFGAFVDIGVDRPGLVHISEITTGRLDHPDEVINIAEEVEVEILDINKKKRQINLSMKTLEQKYMNSGKTEEDSVPTAMEMALRAAMDSGSNNKQKEKSRQKNKSRVAQDDILKRTLENRQK